VAGTLYASSTKLLVSWTAPTGQTVDHYIVTAADALQGSPVNAPPTTNTEVTFAGLKSATAYSLSVTACLSADCSSKLTATAPGTTTTPEEYWQIQGSGAAYSNATKVVSDGQTLSYAIRYGSDAPADLAERTRFFYSPSPGSTFGRGLRVATSSSTSTDVSTQSSFSPIDSGMADACEATIDPSGCPEGTIAIFAFQPIPLTTPERMRVFFEGGDPFTNGFPTRLYSLDVQDGYFAEDFHPDSADTICGGMDSTDVTATGACAPTVVVDYDNDGSGSGLLKVRQSKIGYPKQDSWKWDMAPGTFMLLTAADTCMTTQDGLFYATWNGSTWSVLKEEGGCARALVPNAHGPVIVHLGGLRYKVYYEEINGESITQDKTKPLKVLYANGMLSGDTSSVDYDDWETSSQARNVHFLWPDGTLMPAGPESGLGDHFILMPNNNSDTQYMYMNLGGMDDDTPSEPSTGLGMAVLVNP
jgi:hypothetical protein